MTPAATMEQEWISHEVNPSGVEVRYGVNPKRLYQVRKSAKSKWVDAPSVTTVLGVLAKDALVWWGQRVGTQGVLDLFNTGALKAVNSGGVNVLACTGPTGEGQSGLVVAGVPQIEELLKQAKLTVNHTRDKAADRGQGVHDAFELWAKSGVLPDPSMFPPTEVGYVAGLRKFVEESGAIPVASEVQVGSIKHGYAGRYDVRLQYPEDVELVVHRTPVKGEQRKVLAAGVYLDDLKTSKDVYASHFKQLEAYEEASVECGYEPTDGRGVILVDPEGNYKRVPSYAVFADFLTTLKEFKQQEAMEKRRKESK